ncbi:MAG: SEC-C domain-containing protein [Pseudomonadales bacterium]|nr:SEC-C domain-containing protein [Pseudomonadales bacterium]
MARIERNSPCSCGSGKKYKHCHGDPALLNAQQAPRVETVYRFTSIVFTPELSSGTTRLVVNGSLFIGSVECLFLMILEPLDGGNWRIQQFGWKNNKPKRFNAEALGKTLIEGVLSSLQALTVKAEVDTTQALSQASAVKWIQQHDAGPCTPYTVSYRPRLLQIISPDWSTLWDRIETRLDADPQLEVSGFSPQTVKNALASLRPVFGHEWVEAVYQRALGKKEALMNAALTPEVSPDWFPAFHLAVLANGVLCSDPALHYLVDLGLAIATLESFKGRQALLDQVKRTPALHHQLCLAAELHVRKLAANADEAGNIIASLKQQEYLIHTFAVDGAALAENLKTQLAKAADNAGASKIPLVAHIILERNSWYDPEHDTQTLALMDSLASELPASISAVVLGRRFIDANGGHVKRQTQKILVNKQAAVPVDIADLAELFISNDNVLHPPCLNSGIYFLLRGE